MNQMFIQLLLSDKLKLPFSHTTVKREIFYSMHDLLFSIIGATIGIIGCLWINGSCDGYLTAGGF